jgi:hypothetical protein
MSPATAARRFALACLLVTLLAAVAQAAAGAGEARAFDPGQRFWATFRAEKTIKWAEPRWTGRVDCYHSWWTDAVGSQTETYRSTKPVKVLVYRSGLKGQSTFLKWRTWDPYDEGSSRSMPGMGKIERKADRVTDWTAGICGVRGVIIDDEGRERTTPVPPPPGDCGTQTPAVYGSLSFDTRRSALSIYSAGDDQDKLMGVYRACELQKPYVMQELRWSSDPAAKLPRAALLDPSVPVVRFVASRQYSQQWFTGGMRGIVLASGSVRWTVTFRRAAVPVVKGRRRR